MSGSGISWAMCKSAPRSRQITTPAPHHSVFYRSDALPAAQPTASKHWRATVVITYYYYLIIFLLHDAQVIKIGPSVQPIGVTKKPKDKLGICRNNSYCQIEMLFSMVGISMGSINMFHQNWLSGCQATVICTRPSKPRPSLRPRHWPARPRWDWGICQVIRGETEARHRDTSRQPQHWGAETEATTNYFGT